MLAQPKYYLAQASLGGLPKLPMGPAPVGLHARKAQTCSKAGRYQHPHPQEHDTLFLYYLLQPKLPMSRWLAGFACCLVPAPPRPKPPLPTLGLLPIGRFWGLGDLTEKALGPRDQGIGFYLN